MPVRLPIAVPDNVIHEIISQDVQFPCNFLAGGDDFKKYDFGLDL